MNRACCTDSACGRAVALPNISCVQDSHVSWVQSLARSLLDKTVRHVFVLPIGSKFSSSQHGIAIPIVYSDSTPYI